MLKAIKKRMFMRRLSKRNLEKIMTYFGALGFDGMLITTHPEFKGVGAEIIVSHENVDEPEEAILCARRLCMALQNTLKDSDIDLKFTLKRITRKAKNGR